MSFLFGGKKSGEKITVVGSVILSADGKRFLAAQRNYPPKLAGSWELPGGKAKRNETPRSALERELLEELGIRVQVLERLNGTQRLSANMELQIWTVRITHGTPRLIEGHSQVRWLTVGELWVVPWLDSNKQFVRQVPRYLR